MSASKYRNNKVFVINLDTEQEIAFRTKSGALEYCLNNGIDSEITVFDSNKEYKRWGILKLQRDCGEILNLQRQVPYLLIPAQHEQVDIQLKTKKVTRSRRVEAPTIYKADFQYNLPDGKLIVEDVKSKETRKLQDYIIKRKLMLWIHGIKLTEII